tara:strand:+ start:66 stop:410 length:345 start_codon:yes stop_codon:yes gene_type:complete
MNDYLLYASLLIGIVSLFVACFAITGYISYKNKSACHIPMYDNLPDGLNGGYQPSCVNCKWDFKTRKLTCNCGYGQYQNSRKTSITIPEKAMSGAIGDLCYSSISNNGGQLVIS